MKYIWSQIEDLIEDSKNEVFFSKSHKECNDSLLKEGIKKDSALGLIISNASSIVVEKIIRILGNGSTEGAENIFSWNKRFSSFLRGEKVAIAYDVWGGVFAIGNGDFEGDINQVWYFAPDTLEWENLEIDYSGFLRWAFSGNLELFYEAFKWKGLHEFVENIDFDEGLLVYPFLWSEECEIEDAEKSIIPFQELIKLHGEYSERLGYYQ